MVDVWTRASHAAAATNPYWGGAGLVPLLPAQTVLRSWVNISVWGIWAPQPNYPPGDSILRAGLIVDDAVASSDATPISQENEPWMWIGTLHPSHVQLSRATDVNWFIQWALPADQSVKAQRKHSGPNNQVLRVAWEFELSRAVANFSVQGWNASLDCLIRNPDGVP
jgi:hypothetical protein